VVLAGFSPLQDLLGGIVPNGYKPPHALNLGELLFHPLKGSCKVKLNARAVSPSKWLKDKDVKR